MTRLKVTVFPKVGVLDPQGKAIEGARLVHDGGADVINIADGPRAVARMGPGALAQLVRAHTRGEGDARLLDYDVTIQARPDAPLVMGDNKDGTMSIRIAPADRRCTSPANPSSSQEGPVKLASVEMNAAPSEPALTSQPYNKISPAAVSLLPMTARRGPTFSSSAGSGVRWHPTQPSSCSRCLPRVSTGAWGISSS